MVLPPGMAAPPGISFGTVGIGMILISFWLVNSRLLYGSDRARKNEGPCPFARPKRFNGLGWAVFFTISCPCTSRGPSRTRTPDRSPFQIGVNKWDPVQGMSAGRGQTGAGQRLRQNSPLAACNSRV